MSDKVHIEFYISTGRKNAMYTLRQTRSSGSFFVDNYICNLAAAGNEDAAEAKARDYVERARAKWCPDASFSLYAEGADKRRGKLSANDTRCIEDIEAGVFPFGKHRGSKIVDAPASYLLFFADKLSDETLNPVMSALAAACMGAAMEAGHVAAREVKRELRAAADALSAHVGTIGERRMFTGEVVTKFFKDQSDIGQSSYWINKVRCGNDLIVYIGNEVPAAHGETVTFKATIKKHSEYKEVKSTQVNRPKFA